jgi:hypothetical protein
MVLALGVSHEKHSSDEGYIAPRGSRYTTALRQIQQAYAEKGERPLTREEILETLECTQGLHFPPRTTIDHVIGKLIEWGVLSGEGLEGSDEKVFRPKSQ